MAGSRIATDTGLARANVEDTEPTQFVRSIKESCLDRMILFGERSLRRASREFLAHYHRERNHQGLDNLTFPEKLAAKPDAPVEFRQRLGGMLKYYHRQAA